MTLVLGLSVLQCLCPVSCVTDSDLEFYSAQVALLPLWVRVSVIELAHASSSELGRQGEWDAGLRPELPLTHWVQES